MQIIKKKPQVVIPVEPVEYAYKALTKRVAIWDTETDPFKEGRVVAPFTCGFYLPDSGEYYDFWGDDCIAQFFEFLDVNFAEESLIICTHNGGNFDFYFMLDYFDNGMKPFIINGRLVRVFAHGHEFRDSYAMIPVALGTYDKIEIDYSKFERPVREANKQEILTYQKRDCTALAELVMAWYEMFGDKLTMAGAALATLRSYHGFETMLEATDDMLRNYYFGGRCQAFETGIIEPETNNFYVYDVNSMYPFVMANTQHPITATPRFEFSITDRTMFAHIRAYSNGALPVRKDDGGLNFPVGTFDFYACIHEINAGLETKTLRIIKVYETIYFDQTTTYDDFINTFYKMRLEAREKKDNVRTILYKLIPNSSYGKQAQDPRKYENYLFNPDTMPMPLLCEPCHDREKKKIAPTKCLDCEGKTHSPYGWYLHTVRGAINIFARPQKIINGQGFFNVASAASITSAARALLLRGINNATRPVYCDTDSIICEHLDATLDDKELGAWKLEATGTRLYIGGKKLYAVETNNIEDAIIDVDTKLPEIIAGAYCCKKASKGVRLKAEQIARVCAGEVVEYSNPVPKFHLDGSADFVTRHIKST